MDLWQYFQYGFFVRGLIASVLVGALCGLIGVYVVLRRMSYIGHGLSHAAFGGAVVSYLLAIDFYLGASVWGFLAAVLINTTARRRQIGADAAIGIVTTASFAIGVALISKARRFTKNFEAALFGNVLGVANEDLVVIGVVCLLVAVIVFFWYQRFLFVTFDPEVAPIYGVPTAWVDTLFALILAGTIIASIQVIGVTLIAAGLVIPATTARLLTNSFHRMIGLSVLLGALFGLVGMILSFALDISSGAAIVLVSAATFGLVLAVSSRWRTRRSFPARASTERQPQPVAD